MVSSARLVAGRPTGTTVPDARRGRVRVRRCELVTVLAVCLAGILGRQAVAAPVVLGVRDDIQVRRVDTRPIAAEVVDGQPVGNRAVFHLPCDPVGVPAASVGSAKHSVSAPVRGGYPRPAFVRSPKINLRPEASLQVDTQATRAVPANEPQRLAQHPAERLVVLPGDSGLLAASALAVPIRDVDGGPNILALHRGKGLLSRCHGTGRLPASRSSLVACNYTTPPLLEVHP